MKNTTKHSVLCGLLVAFAGCVGPVEIAPLPYAHPANPAAPAGSLPPLATGLDADEKSAGGTEHEMSGHRAPTAGETKPTGKYQCPMHAEVRSDEPGRCPVCGMKLVERKDGDGRHEGHHEQ
jgi:hypothetical protein